MEKINWVSLQNLIGGNALGAEKAFGTVPLMIVHQGLKNDEHYINYMNNTRGLDIPIVQMDNEYTTFVTEEGEKIFNDVINNNHIHVAVCTPYCAGLSSLNASSSGSKARGDADNDQNQNMYGLSDLGMRIGADVVTFENAPAAYTKAGKGVVDRLKQIADSHEYSTHLLRTDTIHHGIPQARKRTFVTYFKDSMPPEFTYETKPYLNLYEYLDKIPASASCQDITKGNIHTPLYDFVLDYTKKDNFLDAVKTIEKAPATTTTLIAIEKIGFDKGIEFLTERNQDGDAKYVKLLEHAKYKKSLGKSFWDSSSYVPNRGEFSNSVIGKHIHMQIVGDRPMNVREMMHLMGLPHDFEILEASKNWHALTQNVPTCTSYYICNEIKKYLNNELDILSESFVKQDNLFKRIDVGGVKAIEEW